MEQQIQDLVASIRKEGIDNAKAEADRIIQEAQAKADAIVKEAEKEREKMISDAEKSIALEKSSSEATIRQAARDVSLSLKKSIEDEYSKILAAAISREMHGSNLVSIISAVLSGDLSGKAVELPAEDLKALSAELSKTFASEIASGLEFRPSQSVQAGFRISEKDGSGYIEISPDKCQELLYPYLSDSLKQMI